MKLLQVVGMFQQWVRNLLHSPRVFRAKRGPRIHPANAVRVDSDPHAPSCTPDSDARTDRSEELENQVESSQDLLPPKCDTPEASCELVEAPPEESDAPPAVANSGTAVDNGGTPDLNAENAAESKPNSPHDLDTPLVVPEGSHDLSTGKDLNPKEATDDEQGTRAPRDIPSRRTGPTSRTEKLSPRQPMLEPELVCRKSLEGRYWDIVLIASDERSLAEVRQDGNSLTLTNGECRLSSFASELSVTLESGERHDLPLCGDQQPLIFKLRANWSGSGRMVKHATKGHFIVIAPNGWHRTGRVRVESEGCADAGFTAHYFFRAEGDLDDDFGGFRECEVSRTASRFQLTGKRVFDDSDHGELFVGKVPRLKCTGAIVWARVGEESQDGWRGENFDPSETDLAEVLKTRQGRFFVRTYDENGLLDSGEFRYLRDLKEIRVNGELYEASRLLFPSKNGHPSTRISVNGVGGSTIRPVIDRGNPYATSTGGEIVVKPDPKGDSLSCAIQSGTDKVDIELDLPRLWWGMSQDESGPDEWHDNALVMTRQRFRDYASDDWSVWLRLPRRIPSVRVGFNQELDRAYRRGVRGTDTQIPLTDFIDYSLVDERLNNDALFKIELRGEELTLLRISADPAPMISSFAAEPKVLQSGEAVTLRWQTRNAETGCADIQPGVGPVELSGSIELTPNQTETYTLRLRITGMDDVTKSVTVPLGPRLRLGAKPSAWVKRRGGGWKRGKGFSHRELQGAGVKVGGGTCGMVPVDNRRQSKHPANIQTIRGLTNG